MDAKPTVVNPTGQRSTSSSPDRLHCRRPETHVLPAGLHSLHTVVWLKGRPRRPENLVTGPLHPIKDTRATSDLFQSLSVLPHKANAARRADCRPQACVLQEIAVRTEARGFKPGQQGVAGAEAGLCPRRTAAGHQRTSRAVPRAS